MEHASREIRSLFIYFIIPYSRGCPIAVWTEGSLVARPNRKNGCLDWWWMDCVWLLLISDRASYRISFIFNVRARTFIVVLHVRLQDDFVKFIKNRPHLFGDLFLLFVRSKEYGRGKRGNVRAMILMKHWSSWNERGWSRLSWYNNYMVSDPDAFLWRENCEGRFVGQQSKKGGTEGG